MAITYHCRACGCDVSVQQIRAGQAKRDGNAIYCVECSTLIAEPAEAAAAAPGLPQETPPYGQPAGVDRRATGPIATTPAGSGRPARPSARRAGPSARQAAARPSARNIEPEARRRPSQRVEPAARQRPSSNRMPPAAGRRTSAQRVDPAPPARSSSPRTAAARPSVSSRRAQAAEVSSPQEQHVAFASGTSLPSPSRNSSRHRAENSERRSRNSIRGSAAGQAKSNVTLIALISGGLVIIGLVALLAGAMGTNRSTPRKKTTEKLTPQECVRLADEQLRMGNKMGAVKYLHQASEGWAEIGQDEEARQCNMRAYSIGKNTTINDY